MESLSGIVLAGGKSSRMRKDKATLIFKNKALIEYPLEILSNYCKEILISTKNEDLAVYNYKGIKDVYENSGPLGGLHATISQITTENALVLTCDTPFISKSIIDRLIKSHKKNTISICETSDGIHPLIGIYPATALNNIITCLNKKCFKMTDVLDGFPNQKLYFETEFNSSFANLNSPKDIEKWK